MKHRTTTALLVLPALLLALAGCNSGQETGEPTPADVVEQQPEPVAETPAPEGPAADTQDAKPEIVEESAAVSTASPAEEQPIVLAQSNAAQDQDWKFSEGKEFHRLVPTQPTVGGADKIEVAEFFWYGCSHCYEFESYVNRWAENAPANVRFVRVPALWNPLVRLHGQMYYTEQVLVKNGAIDNPGEFRAAVFNEYHRRGNRLTSASAIEALFARHGVSAEDFQNAWKSFEVDQKLRVADDLARRYSISGVPAIVVNGKYRTGAGEAGGFGPLIEVVNELVARESAR
jgi:thiol:disulfide interchange protein DsbA